MNQQGPTRKRGPLIFAAGTCRILTPLGEGHKKGQAIGLHCMIRDHESDNYYGGNLLRNAWGGEHVLKFITDIKSGAALTEDNYEIVKDYSWNTNMIAEDNLEIVRKHFDKVEIFLIEISQNKGGPLVETEEHIQKYVDAIKEVIGDTPIVWQCHFRPHIYAPGYTDKDLTVCPWHEPLPARERIYNVLKKEKYFLDPTDMILECGHESVLWDVDLHWNLNGCKKWWDYTYSKLKEWELIKAEYLIT